MGQSGFIKGLEIEVACGTAAFRRGRGACSALARYETPHAVIAALADAEEGGPTLLATLIARTRQTDAPTFWRTLLLRAFVPMVARLGKAKRDGDDGLQHAAVAFLAALAAFDEEKHGARPAAYLLGKTRQLLHKAKRREAGRETPVEIRSDDSDEDEPRKPLDPRLVIGAPDLAQALVLRETLLASPHGAETLRLMVATLGEQQSFREYVREQHGDLPAAEEERHVVRLQRARHRATERAREALRAWRVMTTPLHMAA